MPHSEAIKNTKKLSVFSKNGCRYSPNFSRPLIIFLEPTIGLFTEMLDLQK